MTLPLPQTTDGNPARPFRRGRASSVSTKKSIDAKNLVDAFQSDSRAHCVDRRGVGLCAHDVERSLGFARATTFDASGCSKRAPWVSGEGKKSRGMRRVMQALSSVSDRDLRQRLAAAVSSERLASADVIFHLAELDRRKLYLEEACSSLFAYCVERLSYSEDGANKRVRVARLVQRFPQVLDELASGAIHLTGLFLLSGHLTEDNAEQVLVEARGKSKRQIEELIARWYPRPDVAPTITTSFEVAQGEFSTMS